MNNKQKKIAIKLTQQPHANGGSVSAGLRELKEWYEAAAADDQGNEYRVVWKIISPDAYDESDACDWYSPWAVFDNHYNDVSETVSIID